MAPGSWRMRARRSLNRFHRPHPTTPTRRDMGRRQPLGVPFCIILGNRGATGVPGMVAMAAVAVGGAVVAVAAVAAAVVAAAEVAVLVAAAAAARRCRRPTVPECVRTVGGVARWLVDTTVGVMAMAGRTVATTTHLVLCLVYHMSCPRQRCRSH